MFGFDQRIDEATETLRPTDVMDGPIDMQITKNRNFFAATLIMKTDVHIFIRLLYCVSFI